MEITTSTVKDIKTVKKFQGERGVTWYFTVEMDNGDKGQVGKKTEDGLKSGDTLTYTLDKSGRYVRLKEPSPYGYTAGNSRWKTESTAVIALTLAKDIMVANLAAGGKTLAMDAALGTKMTTFADHLQQWLKAKL